MSQKISQDNLFAMLSNMQRDLIELKRNATLLSWQPDGVTFALVNPETYSVGVPDQGISTNQIADGSITADQILALTITAEQIAAGTITANEILANTITADEIAANTITADEIAAGTITASEIEAGSITANEIATDTIVAGNIAANAITTVELSANSVTATHIVTDTITASQIASNTITASEIFAGTITSTQIASASITADRLNVTAGLSSITSNMGSITSGTITGGVLQTNTTGARVIMDSTGLRGYALDGVTKTFEINLGSGVASFTGIANLSASSVVPSSVLSGLLPAATIPEIAGKNLIVDSSFEHTDVNIYWAGYAGGTQTRDTVIKRPGFGAASLKMTALGSGGTPQLVQFNSNAGNIPGIQEGKTYTLSYYALNDGGVANRRMTAFLYFYTAAAVPIILQQGAYIAMSTSTTDWQRYSATFTAPATTGMALIYIRLETVSGSMTAGEIYHIDDMQLEQGITATPYAPRPDELLPASIVGSKIANDTLTSTNIAASAITSSELASGAVIAGKITAGTIVSADVAAGSINADRIIASSITATQIAAGAITTNTLAAGAVTAGKISIEWGGNNMLLDSGFSKTGLPDWTPFNGTISSFAGQQRIGSPNVKVCKMVATAASFYLINPAVNINVLPSKNYTISAYFKADTTGRNCHIILNWYTSGAVFISQSISTAVADVTTGYTRSTFPVTSPATAGLLVAQFYIAGNIIGEVHYVSDVQMEPGEVATGYARMPGEILPGEVGTTQISANAVTTNEILAGTILASDIATGTITADRMVAGTITAASAIIADAAITNAKIVALDAAKITSGFIDAARIDANTITATHLTATAIDGKTITGATLRTAASGSRVEISGTAPIGIKKYDASGNVTVAIGQTDGLELLAGTGISPPNDRKIQWKDGSGNQVSEILSAKYSGHTIIGMKPILSPGDTSEVSLSTGGDDEGYAGIILICGSGPDSAILASAGLFAQDVILRDDGTSDYVRKYETTIRAGFSYSNGWRNYAGGSGGQGYYRDGNGVVHLEGLIDKNGGNWAVNETMITLPSGFRPPTNRVFIVDHSPFAAGYSVTVYADGTVKNTSGGGSGNPVGYVSLDGISFNSV